jgi:hypothetical protein
MTQRDVSPRGVVGPSLAASPRIDQQPVEPFPGAACFHVLARLAILQILLDFRARAKAAPLQALGTAGAPQSVASGIWCALR